MADKDDDFDAWLDDTEDVADDLSQDNIDALLGAAGPDDDSAESAGADAGSAELDQNNIDALLGLGDEASPADNSSDEMDLADLDQENIDALLAGDTAADTAEDVPEDDSLNQDNIDALLSGTGYDSDASDDFNLDELDQANIDALLNSTEGEAGPDVDELPELAQDNIDALLEETSQPEAAVSETLDELDQDNIDALLNNESSTEPGPEKADDLDELFAGDSDAGAAAETGEAAQPDDDIGELDQDNIDALLNESEPEPQEAAPEVTPEDQDEGVDETAFESELDEMDQLFADIDSEASEDDPFQAEEIDFAEMLGQTEGDDQEFIELEADEEDSDDEFMQQAGAEDDSEFEPLTDEEGAAGDKKAAAIPVALAQMNKGVVAGIGGGAVILLLIGLFFLFSGPDETNDMATVNKVVATVEQTPQRQMPENFIPVTEDASYDMGGEGGELAIELAATDKDKQPLIYEITKQPQHGRLSGTAPMLTYLPDSTFPGEDRFEFKVNDGTDSSDIAEITITGPNLAAIAKKKSAREKKKAEKKIFKPQKPKVLAKDVKYYTISTGAVTIDWSRLWQEANSSPYLPESVHVEIADRAIKGTLEKQGRTKHIYTPDPFQTATDTIRYRFKKGGFRSATKTITINVELGNPAPEINFVDLAEGYLVGQNVIVDASASRDEARDSLQFYWEQVAGVQLNLQVINKEGSKVAFTMPSSFYTDPNPGPTLAVTAVDNTGKETRKEIKIKTISRRQAALWRGRNGSLSPDPPMEGNYFPWPFGD